MESRQERVMVFIDGSNMYHSLKKYFSRTDIDLGKFCSKVMGKRRLIRIYYYNARVGRKEEPERYIHQRQFFDSVAEIPYTELRLGRLVYNNWPNTPPYEKGVDVQLATDMLTHSFKNNYDTAVLVAGDNDFVSALQAVKDNGKHIEVALFGKEETSQELRRVADKIIPINARILNECWKQQQPVQKQRGQQQPQMQQQSQPQMQHQPQMQQQFQPQVQQQPQMQQQFQPQVQQQPQAPQQSQPQGQQQPQVPQQSQPTQNQKRRPRRQRHFLPRTKNVPVQTKEQEPKQEQSFNTYSGDLEN